MINGRFTWIQNISSIADSVVLKLLKSQLCKVPWNNYLLPRSHCFVHSFRLLLPVWAGVQRLKTWVQEAETILNSCKSQFVSVNMGSSCRTEITLAFLNESKVCVYFQNSDFFSCYNFKSGNAHCNIKLRHLYCYSLLSHAECSTELSFTLCLACWNKAGSVSSVSSEAKYLWPLASCSVKVPSDELGYLNA